MPYYSGSCGYSCGYPPVGCGYGCGPFSAYLPYGPYGIPPVAYGGIYGSVCVYCRGVGCGRCRRY